MASLFLVSLRGGLYTNCFFLVLIRAVEEETPLEDAVREASPPVVELLGSPLRVDEVVVVAPESSRSAEGVQKTVEMEAARPFIQYRARPSTAPSAPIVVEVPHC